MDGHKLHCVLCLIPLLPGLKSNLLQKFIQAQILPEFPFKLICNALKLRQIFQSLLIPKLPDISLIARIPCHLVDNLGDPLLPAFRPQRLDQLHKGGNIAVLKNFILQMLLQSGKKSSVTAVSDSLQIIHLRPAKPSAGSVCHPPEGQIIIIGD